MKKKIGIAIVSCTLFVAGMFSGQAMAEQGNMQAAKEHLRAAINSLNMAEPNKGGHRERAIGLAQQALDEVQAGIDYANNR